MLNLVKNISKLLHSLDSIAIELTAYKVPRVKAVALASFIRIEAK